MLPEALLAGLFGLLIGSFLNVCIYRLPRDQSVVRPRSKCPNCGAMVRAWDNIPVVSWLLLGGRCRDCKTRIPVRYVLVELLTALLFAFFIARDGLTIAAARDCVLAAILITLTFTDLETRILPEEFTLGGIAAGLFFSLLTPVGDGTSAVFGLTGRLGSFVDSLLGAVVPAGGLWLTGWLFLKIRKKEGLGFGDVVMIAAIGAFLGPRETLLCLVLASVAGSIVGLIYIRVKKEDPGEYQLPLGSFLGIAGIVTAAFGQSLIDWYAALLR
jgi:leader peptidase (prepilin peptidase)/N-methyltransferase